MIVKPVEFRIVFPRLWFRVTIVTVTIYVFLAAMSAVSGIDEVAFDERFYDYASHLVLLLLIDTFAVWAYASTRVVCISPDCLRGSDVWTGKFLNTTWDSIVEVKPASLLRLPFLKIRSRDLGRVIWLPLFLEHFENFVEATEEYAGPDHPVTRALRNKGYRQDRHN